MVAYGPLMTDPRGPLLGDPLRESGGTLSAGHIPFRGDGS
ncbi:MAG: hypothetical protein QOE89_2134 [Pseudonocardiales bacterium]|nr:hypothetical protein [Pseudonocardiales bacterium]